MNAPPPNLEAPTGPTVGRRSIDPRGLIVRCIRWLDRRGGLSSTRAERAYARCARLFHGVHARVVEDAVVLVGTRRVLVVDIGSGPGDVVAALRSRLPQATVVGVEPSTEMRDISASRRIVALDGRAEDLPLDAGSADLVVSTLSAHHWDDPVAAFREIAWVLRPGGVARIYDVRFAGFGPDEARGFASAAGLDVAAVDRVVLDERLLGIRPYALITIHAPDHIRGGPDMTTEDATVKDPVCGMDIVIEDALQTGLTSRYRDEEYAFCGRGCKLEFDEDPERFLAPDYVPSM